MNWISEDPWTNNAAETAYEAGSGAPLADSDDANLLPESDIGFSENEVIIGSVPNGGSLAWRRTRPKSYGRQCAVRP